MRAGEVGSEGLIGVELQRDYSPVGVPERGFKRFGKPLLGILPHLQAVDHDFHRMLGVLLELGQLVDFMDLAVDSQPHKALGAQLVEELGLFAFAPDDERREDHEPRIFGQLQHVIDHLRHGLRGERDVVIGAVRVADAREQQSQIVVNLGYRADRGARIVARRLLLDGDRRRQALDQVDVGLLHELQELPRIRGERFDVTALALGVQRVKRKR